MTDQELLIACAEGNVDARNELLLKCQPVIDACSFKYLSVWYTREEFISECHYSLLKSMLGRKFDSMDHLRNLVALACYQRSMDLYRTKRRKFMDTFLGDIVEEVPPGDSDDLAITKEAIESLPPDVREVILHFYPLGNNYVRPLPRCANGFNDNKLQRYKRRGLKLIRKYIALKSAI